MVTKLYAFASSRRSAAYLGSSCSSDSWDRGGGVIIAHAGNLVESKIGLLLNRLAYHLETLGALLIESARGFEFSASSCLPEPSGGIGDDVMFFCGSFRARRTFGVQKVGSLIWRRAV